LGDGQAASQVESRRVATLVAPGRYGDGGGLFLVISQALARKWVFRYRYRGNRHDMGLGSARVIPLSRARELAASARASLASGVDPRTSRRPTSIPTFGDTADQLVEDLSPSWRNEKHRAQWRMTLEVYAASLRAVPVNEIDVQHVLAVLKPIWASKPETASRLRGRIERVLDAARAKGHRQGDNPARWRGHLDHLLPVRQRLTRGHHAAMAYADLPRFMAVLRTHVAVAALALEFLILTAARTGEVLGARWQEFDLERAVWTVPGSRMKAGRVHRVPLARRALDILTTAAEVRTGDYVFPGRQSDQQLSFRDWAGEATHFPREIAEAALAHTIGDQTERAYRRGDALEKRRKLMEAWAGFCESSAIGNVLPMKRNS